MPIAESDSSAFSTRIKAAGIAIRHSRGRILFHTAVSRNGLEGVASGGYTYKIIKKASKKGVRNFSFPSEMTKSDITRQILIQKSIQHRKFNIKAWRRLWTWSRGPEMPKKFEKCRFQPHWG